MITQFGYFLYFIGKNYLLWNSVETQGIVRFLDYDLETFYWRYLMKVSTSFSLITNDWKSGGRYFLNVLFDCLWHALSLTVSMARGWPGAIITDQGER
jgi:hypothetical protein